MLRQEPLPCAVIVPFPRTAAPASALLWQEPLTAVSLYPGNLSSEPSFVPARRLPLCAVPQITFRAPPTLGGSYPAQPAADPGLLLVGAGNNSTPRCPPSKSSSLHRSAPRTPCTPRCRLRLSHPAAAFEHFEPTFVTVFSFLPAGSLLTYNYQLRFVTFRQTLCRLFPYGLPLGLPSRLPPRLLLHLHAIAAGRNHLQPIAGKIIQSHPFSLIFSALSQFFPARDARISWLFSAFCSNNVLEQ